MKKTKEEYQLLDGRTIRAKYDRLGMCKISKENLEAFVEEFNRAYRQGKILEKIKENYALMKLDEHKKGHWKEYPHEWGDNWQYSEYECSVCHNRAHFDTDYCPNCGAEMKEE